MQTHDPSTLQHGGSGDVSSMMMRMRGSNGWKHPDPSEYIATYRTQEKASNEKI